MNRWATRCWLQHCYTNQTCTQLDGYTWATLPKDIKLYLMNFLPLEDYAHMAQVNKSWNKTARKHPKYQESQTREATFRRERTFRAEAAARERRERVTNFISTTCRPCSRLGHWWGRHCCLATCALIMLLLYMGFTIMVGCFIWGPMFPSGPSSLPSDELQSPPFQSNVCVVTGSIINSMLCYRDQINVGYRAVFNVTINGHPNKAAVYRTAAAYMECSYTPNLMQQSEAVRIQSLFPVGAKFGCYVSHFYCCRKREEKKDCFVFNMSKQNLNFRRTHCFKSLSAS
jgi:hypothetical protein